MNQARSIYQSDYSSFDWFENNFTSDANEFCSPENIDECIKYISQEFSALGYPSIYSTSSDCPYAVNCDIVKLLNATFDLLRSCNDQTQTKDDLESRNQRLSADLNVLNRKNSLMKNAIEQLERKLGSSLERERQLKEKCDQLTQSLKTERGETKKLTAQTQQQKVAYQHEFRKYENNLNQIKSKLNNLLADKTPNKKLASMTVSHTLPRNTGQRGKWKTSSTSSSAIEDMYNSLFVNYETRSKDAFREIALFRQYMQSVLLQTMDVFSLFQQDDEDKSNCSMLSEEIVISIMNNECRDVPSFDEKFTYLFSVLKKIALNRGAATNDSLLKEIASLKSKISEYENLLVTYKESPKGENKTVTNIFSDELKNICAEQIIKEEKKKIDEYKLAVAKSLEIIEKEKAEVTAQKLALLRLAMQPNGSSVLWHQSLNTLPSISVITSRDGSSRIPILNQLRISSSSPDHIGQSLPTWNSIKPLPGTFQQSKSDSFLTLNKTDNRVNSPVETVNVDSCKSDLPPWAVIGPNNQDASNDENKTLLLESSHNISELTSDLSSEGNIFLLQAAMLDNEKRMANVS